MLHIILIYLYFIQFPELTKNLINFEGYHFKFNLINLIFEIIMIN